MLAKSILVVELLRACISFGPTSRTLLAAIVAMDDDCRNYFTRKYIDLDVFKFYSSFASEMKLCC